MTLKFCMQAPRYLTIKKPDRYFSSTALDSLELLSTNLTVSCIGKILNFESYFFPICSILTCYDSLSCTCFSSGVFSLGIDICTVGL